MGDNRPLRPGTRRMGRNSYKSSAEFLKEDRERLGEEEFNRRMNLYRPKDKMKYGGMKKKKKLKVKKAAFGSMAMGNIKMSKSSEESKNKTASAQNVGDTLGKTEKVKEMLGMSGMKHGGMHKKKYSSGGMSKARGTGCAIRGTNFKGIF